MHTSIHTSAHMFVPMSALDAPMLHSPNSAAVAAVYNTSDAITHYSVVFKMAGGRARRLSAAAEGIGLRVCWCVRGGQTPLYGRASRHVSMHGARV